MNEQCYVSTVSCLEEQTSFHKIFVTQLYSISKTVAHQAPLSMGFSGQEY